MFKSFIFRLVVWFLIVSAGMSWAQERASQDITLAAGDTVRITVFQNPDLTIETRVAEGGEITYPLLGRVQVGGLTIDAAEKQIAKGLREGGFVPQPQVNITLAQILGNRVAVLGQVARPGRVPIETYNTRVTDILATSGGIAQTGDDVIVLVGTREGKPFRKEIDIPSIYLDGKRENDVVVSGGDVIYVHRAPVYYIYGEVLRAGSFRVERGMTIQQALAQAGGPGPRGMEYWIRLHRRNKDGQTNALSPELFDLVQPNDVIYVRESLF